MRGGTFAGSNYGAATLLQACNNGNPEYARVGYLAFDVSTTVSTVVASSLQLAVKTSADSSVLEVVGVTDTAWSASTLTWTGRPAEGAVLGSFTVASLAPHADAFLVGSSLMRQPNLRCAAATLVYGRVKACGLTDLVAKKMASLLGH